MQRVLSDTIATPGEKIQVTLTVKFGNIPGPARGLYVADNIPDSLVASLNTLSVKIGSMDVTDSVTIEQDSSGAIYNGASPVRWILESPPWYLNNLPIGANDSLVIKYDLTIPETAAVDTVYRFPNLLWVTALDSSETKKYEFGHENYPNPKIEVKSTIGLSTIEKSLPGKYSLSQNYPNPFNSSTIIIYKVPERGSVSLVIYDIHGRKVRTIVHQKQNANTYSVHFNADELASGVYFYKLQINADYIETKKMLLIR